MASKHVKCGMTKTEWERVKTLPPNTARMFHKSCDAFMMDHPTIKGLKIPYVSKGKTYVREPVVYD